MARVYEVGNPANFASSDLKIRRDFYPIVSVKCEKAEIEGKDIFWEEFSEPQCYHCQQGGRRMYYPEFYKNDTDEIIPMLTIWPGNTVKLLLSTREGSEDSVSKGKLFVDVTGNNRQEGDVILSGITSACWRTGFIWNSRCRRLFFKEELSDADSDSGYSSLLFML